MLLLNDRFFATLYIKKQASDYEHEYSWAGSIVGAGISITKTAVKGFILGCSAFYGVMVASDFLEKPIEKESINPKKHSSTTKND